MQMPRSIFLLAAMLRGEFGDCSLGAFADKQTVQVSRHFAEVRLPVRKIKTNDIQFAQTCKPATRGAGIVIDNAAFEHELQISSNQVLAHLCCHRKSPSRKGASCYTRSVGRRVDSNEEYRAVKGQAMKSKNR